MKYFGEQLDNGFDVQKPKQVSTFSFKFQNVCHIILKNEKPINYLSASLTWSMTTV